MLSRTMVFDPTTLPDPDPPFMPEDTFVIRADVYPMGKRINGRLEQQHFIEDRLLLDHLQHKLNILQQDPSRFQVHGEDGQGLAQALWRTLEVFAAEHPQLAQPTSQGLRMPHLGLTLQGSAGACTVEGWGTAPWHQAVQTQLRPLSGAKLLLMVLSLACQEDLVIMQSDGQTGRAEALSVCFPSGWRPDQKFLQHFAAIHQPVADHDRLIQASDNLMRAMVNKGPFVRFSWGLTLHPDLDHHPDRPRKPLDPALLEHPSLLCDQVFLRMERQTTLPFPDLQRALFTIRVYMDPLKKRLQQEPDLRMRLFHLLKSVKKDVLEYKGMTHIAPGVLEWLQSGKP